ncbi:hypothetical protein GCM10009789_45170 [Kribbella sancticallisti]|uniref:Uncharacterized protein n=1 Tax=Kribbella sancticallisti TaxID=460087 RepID=A0ABN2DTV3_9ACTN
MPDAAGGLLLSAAVPLREEGDELDFGIVKRLLTERHAWYGDAHSAPRSLRVARREGPESET